MVGKEYSIKEDIEVYNFEGKHTQVSYLFSQDIRNHYSKYIMISTKANTTKYTVSYESNDFES